MQPEGAPGGLENRNSITRSSSTGEISDLLEDPQEPGDRVEVPIHDPLFERDDGVVGDVDVLRTDLGAALRDVAVTDAVLVLERRNTILGIERIHLEVRGVDQETRADALVML